MYYLFILTTFFISLFVKHIELVVELSIFILIFSWYTVFFYYFYTTYTTMLFLLKTNIILIKFVQVLLWIWLIIYNGLPFLWFLVSYTYMKVCKIKTLEEATELTLQKEPVAFYIKWLFFIFVRISGFKLGQEDYKPKFSFLMTPGAMFFYFFWGNLIKICILLIFK